MKLNQLQKNSKHCRKRVGRGIGSGKGKTCGKGHKGQKCRSGASINGFEGGQMSIFRRLPKRGFSNKFSTIYQTVNLSTIQACVDKKKLKDTVNSELLFKIGVIKKKYLPVKILAKGSLSVSMNFNIDMASKSAISSIEKLGGSVTLKKKDSLAVKKSSAN